MTGDDRLSILITGGSSFTGWSFITHAAANGHLVVAPLARRPGDYQGVRARRVRSLMSNPNVTVVEAAPAGSEALLECVHRQDRLDVVGIHHAVVGDYRSPDFDVGAAVSSATAGADQFLAVAADRGVRGLALTHSVFESDAGRGSDPRPIGLYGVAKRATCEVWAEVARRRAIPVRHFTITNPVGPMEEPRLVAHLVRTWRQGEVPRLNSPQYLRDNVASPVLAAAYLTTLRHAADGEAGALTPSMWRETNIDFARRVATQFGLRWGSALQVGAEAVPSVDEPSERVGLDPVDFSDDGAESRFWDAYADFYRPDESTTGR